MKIKGIYHCEPKYFGLVKSLGFTHTECSTGALPGPDLSKFPDFIKAAHEAGLHTIAEFGFNKNLAEGLNALRVSGICKDCLIGFVDEPNMEHNSENYSQRKYTPEEVSDWSAMTGHYDSKTTVTLGPLDTWDGYENCADIVAFDWYGKTSDLWSMMKIAFRVLKFRIKHRGELMAVPPLRYSAQSVKEHDKFWSLLGVKNRFWYCFNTGQNDYEEHWLPENLDKMLEFQEVLRSINKEK